MIDTRSIFFITQQQLEIAMDQVFLFHLKQLRDALIDQLSGDGNQNLYRTGTILSWIQHKGL